MGCSPWCWTPRAGPSRRGGEEFLALAGEVPLRVEVEEFRLEEADEALQRLQAGEIRGATVLRTS